LAKELAEVGAKVVLVEAGRMPTPQDFYAHQWPYEFSKHEKPTYSAFAPPDEVRYENSDSIYFNRIWAVGGQTNYWNAVSLRFAERDFRERSVAGVEEDWPLTYQDLAPFYSRAEKTMGVTGTREGLDIVPDGEYLKPLKPRCSEIILKRACTKLGIPLIPARKAVLTESYDDRAPCHYCGHCMEGCDVGALFSTTDVMIPKGQKTGNLQLLQNKIARELLVDQGGKVRAVSVIDRLTRAEEEISARVFAVCCGTSESARLLLNSRSPRFPNGVANNNDMVGRYLHGNVAMDLYGYLEELVGTPPVNNDGATDHSYIPRFNQNRKDLDFAGGYQFQVNYASYMYPYSGAHRNRESGGSWRCWFCCRATDPG
jgi:choline dehydrogenase-like flavoprotein